jgi:hypothetical protein
LLCYKFGNGKFSPNIMDFNMENNKVSIDDFKVTNSLILDFPFSKVPKLVHKFNLSNLKYLEILINK